MQFVKKMNKLINLVWQEVKPYALMIDESAEFDDKVIDKMIKRAENFRYNHKEFSGAVVQPQPDDDHIHSIDTAVSSMMLNFMYLISQFAELSGLVKLEGAEDEQLERNQVSMFKDE